MSHMSVPILRHMSCLHDTLLRLGHTRAMHVHMMHTLGIPSSLIPTASTDPCMIPGTWALHSHARGHSLGSPEVADSLAMPAAWALWPLLSRTHRPPLPLNACFKSDDYLAAVTPCQDTRQALPSQAVLSHPRGLAAAPPFHRALHTQPVRDSRFSVLERYDVEAFVDVLGASGVVQDPSRLEPHNRCELCWG